MPDRYALVLAGGRGERFWPWSRPERPKQLLPLAKGGRTLLAATLERIARLIPSSHTLVLTARDLVPAVRAACPPGTQVIGEPIGRNTAPAIGAAAHWVRARARDAAFCVLPSDHAIDDEGAFTADLERGFRAAETSDVLVTFGIRPTAPETAFGYLRRGEPAGDGLFRVAEFTEKPDRSGAEEFLKDGRYAWNAGIFVWRASALLDGLRASRPELAKALEPLAGAADGFEERLGRVLPACESISVDYAVLERAPNVLMVDSTFDWDDLGSWNAWARRQPRDERGNVRFGDTVAIDCDRCVIVGENGTAAALGLDGVVVVHADGATLTCPIERVDEVRRVVEALRTREPKR